MSMKSWIKFTMHVLVSGAFVLPFSQVFSDWKWLFFYCALTMLLGTICYVIRQKAERFWVFVSSHILLIAGGIFLILQVGNYKWYAVIWTIVALYSAILGTVPSARYLDDPGYFYVGFLVCIYLASGLMGNEQMVGTISLLLVVFLFLLTLLYRNLESMDEFIERGNFSGQPDEHGIRRVNARLSLLYVGGVAAILGMFSLFRTESIWGFLAMCGRKILVFLIRLLSSSDEQQEIVVEEEKNGMAEMKPMFPEAQEQSELARLLSEIFRGVLSALIVLLLIAGIVYGIRYLYRHFNRRKNRQEDNRLIESLAFEQAVSKERKSRILERFDRNPAGKIRRMYKRKVGKTANDETKQLAYLSPEEQVKLLCESGIAGEMADEIVELYEKARYTKDMVTDGDVERFRAVVKMSK